MKKLSLFIAVCLMLNLSCSKKAMEEEPGSNEKKVKLSFAVAAAPELEGQIGIAEAPLSSLIKQLTFVIYRDGLNTEVARQTQLSVDPLFGQLSFELPIGEYKVVAIGSKAEFGINKFYRNNEIPVILPFSAANMEYWQPNSTMGDKHYKTDDTFFGKRSITVGSGTSQQVIVQLKRIVGKLEVIVEDVETFTLDVDNEATGYMFDSEKSFGIIDNDQFQITNENGPISLYILRTDQPLRIELSIGTNLSSRRELTVPIYKNKRTIVKGNLFTPIPHSFSVSIDDQWLPDTAVVDF
ncbi:hypothetical protein PBAL39_00135 [Pedobacter sp. BAL39]|uniref:FimB/Mfa2 family fimbrial subunit n=1 Tax=Pedobacter sp. BAL39 TaxID=391596 RepID=UPI0001559E80|nr:FimB/Mfa2 family fimbrial subunit [Pedobacter sp. BAL39]EDM34893.1 hypothetical protein PBAL39_00135 [Pedobacter sp. BAL39]